MIEMMTTAQHKNSQPSIDAGWKLAVKLIFNTPLPDSWSIRGTAFMCDVQYVVSDVVTRPVIVGSTSVNGKAFSSSETSGVRSLTFYTRPVAGVNTYHPNYGLEILCNLVPGSATVATITGIDEAQVRRLWISYASGLTTVPASISPYLRHLRFYGATALNSPNVLSWDTSLLTSMNSMFYGANAFNQPIGIWNTANVTDMAGMFYNNFALNRTIASWDVNKVNTIDNFLYGSRTFNQDLSSMIFKSTVSRTTYDTGTTAWNVAYRPKFTG